MLVSVGCVVVTYRSGLPVYWRVVEVGSGSLGCVGLNYGSAVGVSCRVRRSSVLRVLPSLPFLPARLQPAEVQGSLFTGGEQEGV